MTSAPTSPLRVGATAGRRAEPRVADAIRREIVQWDVPTWWRPVEHFGTVIRERGLQGGRVLEVGARDGGTALYLARYLGMLVLATDVEPIQEKCRALHERHGVSHLVSYDVADALHLPYDDNSFDVVVVKSVLGGIASALGVGAMDRAVEEMGRVVRPGGVVLFAENLSASPLHRRARSVRSWSGAWHYPSLDELRSVFGRVGVPVLETTGFAAVFVPESLPRLKRAVAALDHRFRCLVPDRWRYVGFGEVAKPRPEHNPEADDTAR